MSHPITENEIKNAFLFLELVNRSVPTEKALAFVKDFSDGDEKTIKDHAQTVKADYDEFILNKYSSPAEEHDIHEFQKDVGPVPSLKKYKNYYYSIVHALEDGSFEVILFKKEKDYNDNKPEIVTLAPMLEEASMAMEASQKGEKEAKLHKIKIEDLAKYAKISGSGILKHALMDPETSGLHSEVVDSIKKALVNTGNRKFQKWVYKRDDEGVKHGKGPESHAEFAAWISSESMAEAADELLEKLIDLDLTENEKAQEVYRFALNFFDSHVIKYHKEVGPASYLDRKKDWYEKIWDEKMPEVEEEAISSKEHTAGDPDQVVEKQLSHIEKIADEGLGTYESVNAWLYDFYPDFSWNPEGSETEIKKLLDHPRFKEVADKFQKAHDFDIKEELEEAMKEIKDDHERV